jgi:hypothetical protein
MVLNHTHGGVRLGHTIGTCRTHTGAARKAAHSQHSA